MTIIAVTRAALLAYYQGNEDWKLGRLSQHGTVIPIHLLILKPLTAWQFLAEKEEDFQTIAREDWKLDLGVNVHLG